MPPKAGTMVIISHPDDESLWLGGTIAGRVRHGVPVDVVCCTRGEAGKSGLVPPGRELALVRLKELYRACNLLGVRDCFILDLPDGKIKEKDTKGIAVLSNLIRLKQPKELITFGADGITGHRDHRVLHKMVVLALKEANTKGTGYKEPPSRLETLKFIVLPKSAARQFRLRYGKAENKNIITSDVSSYLLQKKKAIACHLSQLAGFRNLLPKEIRLQDEFLSFEFFQEGFI